MDENNIKSQLLFKLSKISQKYMSATKFERMKHFLTYAQNTYHYKTPNAPRNKKSMQTKIEKHR